MLLLETQKLKLRNFKIIKIQNYIGNTNVLFINKYIKNINFITLIILTFCVFRQLQKILATM